MKKSLALFVLLLAAVAAFGQDSLPLDVKGEGVRTVVLVSKFPFTISAPAGAHDYTWFFPPSVVAVPLDDKLEIRSAPEGELTISVKTLTIDFDAKKVLKRSGLINVSVGSAPKPPDPKPPDPPAPSAKVAWVVVVEETAERTPAVARVVTDLAFWQGMKAKGVGWRIFDKDDPEAIAKNYVAHASKAGFPAMVLIGADGVAIRSVKLPATTAEIAKEVGK